MSFIFDIDDLYDIRDTLDAVVTNNFTVEQVLGSMDTLHEIIEGIEGTSNEPSEVQDTANKEAVPEPDSEAV